MDWLMKHTTKIVWVGLGWLCGFIMAGIAASNGWLTGF